MTAFRPLALAVALAAALAAPVFGDRVKLTNGRTLDGSVRDLGDSIELTLAFGGKVVLAKSSIVSIESEGNLRGEYLRRAGETPSGDATAQYELAMWCRDRGLRAEMRNHLERALLLDPRHADALRALGYADLGGKWPDLPPGWSTVTSAHFAVLSALPVAEARAIADDLELFFQEFQKAYSAHFALRPVTDPVRVMLYLDVDAFDKATREEFQAGVKLSERVRSHLDGYADAKQNRLVAKVDRNRGTRNRETLYHEGTHLLVALQIEEGKRISARTQEELDRIRERELARLRSGRGLMWFHEGLAGYYGASSVTEGRFVPGLYVLGGQASVALAHVQEAVRAGRALSLDEVVDAGAAEYLGDRYDLYYGQSWLFVHFLQHFQGAKYRARWFKLVGELRHHDGGVDAFRRVFGFPPSQLQEEWTRHVLEMREGQ